MKKPPKVPRWELRNGIVQCLSIVAMRLGEAEALLAGGFPTQATIVFTFAVEEFGKAVLLRRAFEQSRETDPTVVIDGFYDIPAWRRSDRAHRRLCGRMETQARCELRRVGSPNAGWP